MGASVRELTVVMLVLGAVLAAPQLPILVLLIGKAQRDGAEQHDAWCRQLGIQMSAGECKRKKHHRPHSPGGCVEEAEPGW